MSLLRYGDYVARVGYDAEIDTFFGEVINTADVITFYGASVEELRREMAALTRPSTPASRRRRRRRANPLTAGSPRRWPGRRSASWKAPKAAGRRADARL
jgi:hypothetical protein